MGRQFVRGALRWAALLIMMLPTPGCLVPRSESRSVHTYRLSLDLESAPLTARPPARTGATLLVGPLHSDPGFDSPKMAYVTRPYEVNYFADNQWVDTPVHMLGPLASRVLERTGAWQAVATAPSPLRADYRLDITAVVVVQEFVQSPSRTKLSWNAQLIDLRTGSMVGSKRFEGAQDAPSEDAYGGVRAANRLLASLLGEMATWLGSCVTEQGKAAC